MADPFQFFGAIVDIFEMYDWKLISIFFRFYLFQTFRRFFT